MSKIVDNLVFSETSIKCVFTIGVEKYDDNRGYFMETHKESDFDETSLKYNFVKKMLKLANSSKKELDVVFDQIAYMYNLSKLLRDMIETEKYGIYHATKKAYISWCDFVVEIFNQTNIDMKINPIVTEQYLNNQNQAKRALNSRLSKNNLDKMEIERHIK